MTPLGDIIKKQIEATGPLSVADYMGLCLGHPVYGYYMCQDPFGAQGDFTTAPEISQMFGELIGLWLIQSWMDRGSPKHCHLVECGPGRGTLMSDILRAANMAPDFLKSLDVHLVETSPTLQDIQREKLKEYKVHWHEDLSTLPAPEADIPTFFVANEFFDALPIHQFIKTDDGWHERQIAWDENNTCFSWVLNPNVSNYVTLISEEIKNTAKPQDIAEVSSLSRVLAEIMGQHIAKSNGVGLFIDYGYSKSATGDSFQALKDHDFCSCLDHCGEADLTAHVDFQALKEEFDQSGCSTPPVLEQGLFLQRLGIETRAAQLMANGTEKQKTEISSGLKRLIDPEEMGQLFKVLAVRSKTGPALAGFEAENS